MCRETSPVCLVRRSKRLQPACLLRSSDTIRLFHGKRTRMKITKIEPILVRTPLKLDDAQPHAGGVPKNDVHTVLVKVETDEGLTGWGEAFSNAGWQSTCTAVAQIIAPRVVGRDPSQIAQIQADLHRGLYNTGRSGPTVFAISGLDIALWDICLLYTSP